MNIQKTSLVRSVPILCLFLQCCAIPIHNTWVHNPPLATNVSRIVKGQTTRAEILKYFGIPDIEADGANSKVNSTGPLAQLWEYRRRPDVLSEELFPYSSIDNKHVTFLYLEFAGRGVFALAPLPFTSIAGVRVTGYSNKLLVFIDKNTGVVDDFAYREEF